VTVVALATALLTGCNGCDPEESVSIVITADPGLNTYDGEPHRMDVYFFKVSDTAAFQSANLNQLKGSSPSAPGAVYVGRKNVQPGQTIDHSIGPMMSEVYSHVGVVGAYRAPQGMQRAVAEIPSDCGLNLALGSNAIVSFTGR
jgi:type VI secretion system VasD/TssJ family lipoprotein